MNDMEDKLIPHPNGSTARLIRFPRTATMRPLSADEEIMLAQDAEIAKLKEDVATYKRLWSLRGQVLRRPCLQCGYRLEVKDG